MLQSSSSNLRNVMGSKLWIRMSLQTRARTSVFSTLVTSRTRLHKQSISARCTAPSTNMPKPHCLSMTSWRYFVNSASSREKSSSKEVGDRADKAKLESSPDDVTTTSTVRPIFESSQAPPVKDPDMGAGIKGDLEMVKETFALRDVPKEVVYLGLAGLIPYVATSSTTLFLAWDVQNIHNHGSGFLLNEAQATTLLNILEPVQVGYGAVILSFLGAIHWGLEFAKFGGSAPYRRYILGIVPSAIAWPTVFMPYDYALLAQFAGFVGIYFADAQATTKGWTPKWYGTYRFILTFVVGASIVATLVGRGKIGDKLTEVSSPSGRVVNYTRRQQLGLEEEKDSSRYQKKIKEEESIIKAKQQEKKKKDKEGASGNQDDQGKAVEQAQGEAGEDSEDKDADKQSNSDSDKPDKDKSGKSDPAEKDKDAKNAEKEDDDTDKEDKKDSNKTDESGKENKDKNKDKKPAGDTEKDKNDDASSSNSEGENNKDDSQEENEKGQKPDQEKEQKDKRKKQGDDESKTSNEKDNEKEGGDKKQKDDKKSKDDQKQKDGQKQDKDSDEKPQGDDEEDKNTKDNKDNENDASDQAQADNQKSDQDGKDDKKDNKSKDDKNTKKSEKDKGKK